MDSQILYIAIAVVAVIMLGIGLLIGKLTFGKSSKRAREQAEQEAEILIAEAKAQAETLKQSKLLEAKEEMLRAKTEFERESIHKAKAAEQNDLRLRSKEQSINQKLEGLQRKEQEVDTLFLLILNHKTVWIGQ